MLPALTAPVATLLSGVLGGGMSLFGGMQQADANAASAQQANAMTAGMQMQAQNFNAAQADITRSFAADEAAKARAFNAEEAASARDFNAREAEKAREFTGYFANQANMINQREAMYDREFADAMFGKASRFNEAEAEKSRRFSEQMANTAYERAVADMKRAGINPMLAYMRGGADTPGSAMASASPTSGGRGSGVGAQGAAASGPAASGPAAHGASASSGAGHALAAKFENIAGNAANAALSFARTYPDIKRAEESVKTQQKDTELRTEQGIREAKEGRRLDQTTPALKSSLEAQARENNARATIAELEEWRAKEDAKFYGSSRGSWAREIGNWGRELGTVANTAESVNNIIRRWSPRTRTRESQFGDSFTERWSGH